MAPTCSPGRQMLVAGAGIGAPVLAGGIMLGNALGHGGMLAIGLGWAGVVGAAVVSVMRTEPEAAPLSIEQNPDLTPYPAVHEYEGRPAVAPRSEGWSSVRRFGWEESPPGLRVVA